MQIETPGARLTERGLRDAMGRFATGVTVVTAPSPHGPVGITANSFASLSLEPPLVLWAPARRSQRFGVFVAAPRFAIHVLAAEQADLCRRFSVEGLDFRGLDWEPDPDSVPLIEGCLARFDCAREAVHPGGDHAIVVGRVLAADWRAGAPLVFHSGAFGEIAPL